MSHDSQISYGALVHQFWLFFEDCHFAAPYLDSYWGGDVHEVCPTSDIQFWPFFRTAALRHPILILTGGDVHEVCPTLDILP